MEPATLLLLIGALACPIGMGLMMWLMTNNMNSQHSMPDPQTPANAAERLAALRAQREALEAEIAEAARLAELEARREALLATTSGDSSYDGASGLSEAHGTTR